MELSITFKPQCKDNRTANLMNYSNKMVNQKLKKQNVIKYATWNVRRNNPQRRTGHCIKRETN